MDYKDQKMVNALESIARELSLVNENLNRIANSAIAVMPGAQPEPDIYQPQIVYKCGGDDPIPEKPYHKGMEVTTFGAK